MMTINKELGKKTTAHDEDRVLHRRRACRALQNLPRIRRRTFARWLLAFALVSPGKAGVTLCGPALCSERTHKLITVCAPCGANTCLCLQLLMCWQQEQVMAAKICASRWRPRSPTRRSCNFPTIFKLGIDSAKSRKLERASEATPIRPVSSRQLRAIFS